MSHFVRRRTIRITPRKESTLSMVVEILSLRASLARGSGWDPLRPARSKPLPAGKFRRLAHGARTAVWGVWLASAFYGTQATISIRSFPQNRCSSISQILPCYFAKDRGYTSSKILDTSPKKAPPFQGGASKFLGETVKSRVPQT